MLWRTGWGGRVGRTGARDELPLPPPPPPPPGPGNRLGAARAAAARHSSPVATGQRAAAHGPGRGHGQAAGDQGQAHTSPGCGVISPDIAAGRAVAASLGAAVGLW